MWKKLLVNLGGIALSTYGTAVSAGLPQKEAALTTVAAVVANVIGLVQQPPKKEEK